MGKELLARNIEIWKDRMMGGTFRAIAKKYNLTPERVRQIDAKTDNSFYRFINYINTPPSMLLKDQRMSVRLSNALREGLPDNIKSLQQLTVFDEGYFLRLRNLGKHSLRELKYLLSGYDLRLKTGQENRPGEFRCPYCQRYLSVRRKGENTIRRN